jgi:hypothetical protein
MVKIQNRQILRSIHVFLPSCSKLPDLFIYRFRWKEACRMAALSVKVSLAVNLPA